MKRNGKFKQVLAMLLSMVMILSTMVPAMAATSGTGDVTSYVNDLILYYRDYQDAAQTDIDRTLAEMAEVDAKQAEAWEQIMDYWSYVNSDMVVHTEVAPDGLPEDNSMAIVILGFALNSDGTMKEELIGRLQVGLNTANKYPNAYVVVTGGGTAADNPDVTEGELMGEWLLANGLDESRLIVENKAPNTVGNAENTYKILNEQYPQVKSMVMVTSDYHIPRGCVLFYSKCLLAAYESGGEVLEMVSNAGYVSGHEGYETIALQATGVASVAGISLSGNVELSQLSALTIRQNTMYETGAELDLTVEAIYNTGYVRDVTEYAEITGFDASQSAEQEITVSYTENGTTIQGTLVLTSEEKVVVITDYLEEVIAEAEALNKNSYTEASYARFAPVLAQAKEVLEKDALTVEEVASTHKLLIKEMNKLRPRYNMAYYMNVTASCNTADASKITDGNTSTYWASVEDGVNVPIKEAEVIVELDGTYDLEEIVVRPYYSGDGRYYHYDVYVSEDGENWELAAEYRETDGGSASGNSHPVNTNVYAKYIKIKGVDVYVPDRTDINNFHITEIYAYGEEVNELVLGKNMVSSGSDQSAASSAGALDFKAVDGDKSTYWDAGGYSARPWITVDLGGCYKLDKVNVMNYWKGSNRYYNFEVYTSMDGEYFTYVGGKTTTELETIFGNTVDLSETEVYATHIKVVGTYNSRNSAFHINELRAYGTAVDMENAQASEERKVLQNLVDEYDGTYAAADYTEETFAVYEAALTQAKAALENENSTYTEMKTAKEALTSAVENLVFLKDDTKAEGTLRVATLNLYAKGNPDTAYMKKSLLERYCIDIVGMQEVDYFTKRNNYDMLGSFKDEFYAYSSFKKNLDLTGGEYGTGILSSREILNEAGECYVQVGSEEIRGWQKIDFEYDGKTIAFYNTHFSTNKEARESNLQELLAVMAADPTEYKILTADFNMTKENMYPFLVDYNLANGKDGNWFSTTSDLWFEGEVVNGAGGIDNIITTRNIEVSNISVVDAGENSDHDMVYIDCKFLDEPVVSTEYLDIVKEEAEIRNREGIYTEETFAPFVKAYDEAKAITEETATQVEVNAAAETLIEAMENLVRIIPNAALGKTVAGNEPDAEEPLSNITDGDISTYWGSDGYPEEIVVNLEELYEINELRVVPRYDGNRIYQYEVYGSVDGETYTLIGEKKEVEIESYRGHTYLYEEPVIAQYIKVVMTYHSSSDNVHLGELEVYGLVSKDVNTIKEALQKMIQSYSEIDLSAYVADTTVQLQEELVKAQAVYDNPDASIEDVEAAQEALEAAYNAMEELPDKTALGTLIDENKETDLSEYSTYSAEQFREKLAAAQAVYDNPNARLAEVEQAAADLTRAIEDLTKAFSVARGLTAEVSHNEEGKGLLNDNSNSTYWEAAGAAVNEAEFILDLDGVYDVEKVQLKTAYDETTGLAYHYDVLVSEDKENWTTVVEYRGTEAAVSGGIAHALEDVTARYVKVKGVAAFENGAASDTTFRVIECYVFGEEINNLALHKPVSSSTYQGTYYDRKALNGNRYDYWDGSKYSARPWLIVDLEGLYTIDSINVINYFQSERYYNFEVYTSVDGETYTLAAEKTSADNETVYGNTFTFEEEVTAQYVKVIGTKNSQRSTFHINELRVYGAPVVEKEPIEILAQPTDTSAGKGEMASVAVEAAGEGLTYTWYYKNPGNVKFYKSGSSFVSEDGTKYSIPMYAWRDGQEVYCVITNADGDVVTTNTVTLTMKKAGIEILTQPKNVKVTSGEQAVVTVEAAGEGLTYTWYYKNPGNVKFYKSGASYVSEDGTTYSIKMNTWRDGQQVYCVISNDAGETVQTNTVSLKMVK